MYKAVRIIMMLLIVSLTVAVKGNATYGAALNPKVGEYITLGNIKEPIMWEVVNVKGKELTLMSYSGVTQLAFNAKEVKPCGDWNTSEVKAYLNTSFYNNFFTADEKGIILQYNPQDADKVYLPSLKELGLNTSAAINKLDKTYKEKSDLYQGEKFQKATLNMYQEESGWGSSFATRNSDNSLNRVINVSEKTTNKPQLSYDGGFMKMNIRPVIKISTDFKTDNLQFTKGSKELNGKTITLYTVDYKIKAVYVDSKLMDVGGETPKLIAGSFFVPLNLIADHFKVAIDLDLSTQGLTISKGKETIKLVLNSEQASINGKLYTLGAPIFKEQDVVYIPMKFIIEALGGEVTYKENNINIKTKK
jgi:hypothetical protein